ncbi:hypothetical protein VTH06DRAFT_7374 [Thermothelomyces fergusii]
MTSLFKTRSSSNVGLHKEKDKAPNLPGNSQRGDGPGNTVKKAATSPSPRQKTQEDVDEELRQKMEALAGDGGPSGVEYEDGKPVTMKRSAEGVNGRP